MSLFDSYFQLVDDGQEILSHHVKTLVYKKERDLFDLIDYDNNLAFLEPFCFTFFNSKNIDIPLHQLLFGYITKSKGVNRLDAFSDENGCIFLPEIGIIKTSVINSKLQIEKVDKNKFRVFFDDKEIENDLSFIEYLKNSEIELLCYKHPYYKDYFFEWDNISNKYSQFPAEYNTKKISLENKEKLEKALDLLKKSSPDYFELIEDTNKRIVLFDNLKIRNFVARNIHGMAFIGASNELSEIYFLEEIIHQCGHNVFNAVTAKLSDFFKIDPETSLEVYSKNPNEYRSIYSTLHGLFTISARIDCFRNTLSLSLDLSQRHELLGRLADLKRRFRTGLEFINVDEVFTAKGQKLYANLDSYCEEAFIEIGSLADCFDYSNQTGPDFNYNEFLQNNPIKDIPVWI